MKRYDPNTQLICSSSQNRMVENETGQYIEYEEYIALLRSYIQLEAAFNISQGEIRTLRGEVFKIKLR